MVLCGMGHDLHIDLSAAELASPGRKRVELACRVVRPLEDADLAMLAGNRGTQPLTLKRLSSRHHGLARSLASGVGPGDAAMIHGYDPARVSILQGDPAFQELVGFYTEKFEAAFADMADRLAGLSRDTLDELQDRLEEAPEDFTNKELLAMLDSTLDRTGYGKQSMQTQVRVDLTSRLNAARERALESRLAAAKNITPDE